MTTAGRAKQEFDEDEFLYADQPDLSTGGWLKTTKARASASSCAATAVASEDAKGTKSSTKKRKVDAVTLSSGPGCAACVLCFGGLEGLRQCRKCYLKVCSNCRSTRDVNGRGNDRDWLCEDCSQGGIGLEVLLSAPAPKRSKVTKSGEAPRRSKGGRKFYRKRRK